MNTICWQLTLMIMKASLEGTNFVEMNIGCALLKFIT